jgi:hypothetical protein
VGRAAVLTRIDRPFDRDPTRHRRHGRRANPYVPGLLPAAGWHVGFRANRDGEGQQRGQETGAQSRSTRTTWASIACSG